MTRIPLTSRLIESVQYNQSTRTLHVWFRSGRHKYHCNVPATKFENLVHTDSPGFYYTYYIASHNRKVRKPITWIYKAFGALVAVALLSIPG